MRKNNFNISLKDSADIVKRLDNDSDGRVSYEELQEIFFPLKLGSSVNLNSNFNNSLRYSKSVNRSSNRKIDNLNSSRDNINTNRSQLITNRSVFNSNDLLKSSISQNNSKKSPLRQERTNDNFQSTWSSVNKSKLSPYRSGNYDVDLNASKNTYTSPLRGIRSVSPRRNLVSSSSAYDRQNYLFTSVGSLARSIRSPYRFARSPQRSPLRETLLRSRLSPNRSINKLESSVIEQKNDKYKSLTLARFFNDLIILDSAVEKQREVLSLRSDVTLKDAFLAFDLSETNSVSLVELKEVLKDLNIYSTIDELKLVFKRFDKNLDGKLK